MTITFESLRPAAIRSTSESSVPSALVRFRAQAFCRRSATKKDYEFLALRLALSIA